MTQAIPLCSASELVDGGRAVPFDVVYAGAICRGFAVRFQGVPRAYLNRCSHVAMEMDFQPDRFFDDGGRWLMCATHGAIYAPHTGECAGGPCRGGLVKITLSESGGVVRWHTDWNLHPMAF